MSDLIAHPFGEFVAEDHKTETDWQNWQQYTFRFPNGYGASVVTGGIAYGREDGLWELAVLDRNDQITYDTPITDDVIGWLDPFAVGRTLEQIARLDNAPEAQ